MSRILMRDLESRVTQSILRLQTWLSPAFPTGAYSYSHSIERAVEVGYIHDLSDLLEWLEADVLYGSVRNEAIFFSQALRSARADQRARLLEVAELAAAFRGTAELALESSQQASACFAILRRVWPDELLDWLAQMLHEREVMPVLAVVLGARAGQQGLPEELALPAFLQSYVTNLVTAAVRLIPLGQTTGQLAIAELERVVLEASSRTYPATIEDLGSAAFTVDLLSMAHETQYTRLFRS